MSAQRDSGRSWPFTKRRRPSLKGLRGTPGVLLALLVIIWVGLPLIPEDTGLRFGIGYQAYFTVMLTLGGLFFWLLGADRIPSPRSAFGVTATLTAVLVVTIGALVGAGMAYPQFDLPDPPGTEQASSAPERGEALFLSQQIGCFRCHTVDGTGGTRGPDLTHVASSAGTRIAGLSAEEYLTAKVSAGAAFEYNVPEYVPMMPSYDKLMDEEELNDVVQYLLTLE